MAVICPLITSVIAGAVPRLKPQAAERAAVGVDAAGRVVLFVSAVGDGPLASDLGSLFAAGEAAGGLGCTDALNLDGGPSVQLSVAVGGFRLERPGGWPVPNGIAIYGR